MTASASCTPCHAALALALAAALATLSASPSFAYTTEAQQMCTGDAFRLCSAEIPNIPGITACMVRHRAELSPGCRAVMDKDLARSGGKLAASE